ncbi:MAG: DUF4065 domain-containing protein [bacterium]|nr:DUF4065 domain-containing protein [bacterium]
MAYDAKAIANYFLDLAKSKGEKLTLMKLLKLIYFAHGWHLAITGKPLIDEQVEAWQYGPVIPSVYHEFKGFGNQPITRSEIDPQLLKLFDIEVPAIHEDDSFTKSLLNKIWDTYGADVPHV